MKLGTLFRINAALAGAFGLAFVVAPAQVFSLYGGEPNATLNYTGQLLGAAYIEVGLLIWLVRDVENSAARRAIVLAFLVGNAVGFGAALVAQLNNVVGALGWSTVVIYLLLTLGYGYFQLKPPAAEGGPSAGL